MEEILIIGILGIVAVAVLIYGVISIRRGQQADIEAVLGRYTTNYDAAIAALEAEEEEARQRDTREEPNAMVQALDKAIEKREFARNWKDQLARADLKITPGEYFMAHIASIAVFSVVGFFILFGGNIILTFVAGAAGFFAPRFYVGRRKSKRLHSFEEQLADTLGMWVNGLRSGYSVMQAMEAIATEAPQPTADEFRRVVMEIQLGITREEAFDHLLNRMPSDDLDLVFTAVNIQQEVGGNLAEILEIISHTIRQRIRLKGEIRVMTAQGRMTGYVIGGLPIVLALFLYMVSREYMSRMFTNKTCGWPMLGCAAGMIGMGFAAINKIVTIDI